MIPVLGRFPGEGIGYPLQDSRASLVAQMVKNLPGMQENQILSLGGEEPLEKEMATHSSILPGKFRGQRSLVGYSPWGLKESDKTEKLTLPLLSLYLEC